jgi:hypothetical protein
MTKPCAPWFFLGALALIAVRSLTHVSRSPDEFNFGGEWDALITAKQYVLHSFFQNNFLSFSASYDPVKQHVDIWRYTHYPLFQYLPTIVLARYFGATYSAQFMLGNLVYLIAFAFVLFEIFRRDLTEKRAALLSLLLLCLCYMGYWRMILGSLGTPYTIEIVVAPLLVYGVVRKQYLWLALGFAVLCLDTYDAFIPCVLCLGALGLMKKQKKYLLLALALPLLSLGLRFSANVSYYQSPQLVAGDLLNAFGQRSSGCTLDKNQTVENVRNYGATPACSIEARAEKHLARVLQGIKQLPADCYISYSYGTLFFVYALLRALYSFARAVRARARIEYGPVFIALYCVGTALFGLLLPESMLLGGWTFFDLMPVMIWGMAMLYEGLLPLWESVPLGLWASRAVLLAALFVIARRNGVPAALSDREVDRFTAARLACDNHGAAAIRTNLDYHYFAYLCSSEGYKLAYTERKPGEESFVVIPGFHAIHLGDVRIRGK